MEHLLRKRATCILSSILLLTFATEARPQTSKLSFAGSRNDLPYTGTFATGDFNGDGFPDIATSSFNNMVVILLNDGAGNYKQASAIPGYAGAYFVAGDFNNDGLLDVAFTSDGYIYIALGAGDGTLRNLFHIPIQSAFLRAVDLNGDGNLDLVSGENGIYYLLGNGDGTLQEPVVLPNISSPFIVADVNGDHKPDIVGLYQGNLVVALNQGDGAFSLANAAGYPGYPYALAAGDIDGNSTVDLALVTQNPQTVTLFKGDGLGGFTLLSATTPTFPADDVALLDTNGDGKLDLLYNKVSNSEPGPTNLIIQLGKGDGTFASPSSYATAGADGQITQADTRGTGLLDLLTGSNQQISILPNLGGGVFDEGSFFRLKGVLQSSVSGDFNHDGIRDLVVSVRLSASDSVASANPGEVTPDDNSQFAGAYVLLGTGNPEAPFSVGQRAFIPPDVLDVTTADFNNDGNPDLAFVTGQDLVIYLGLADGTFAPGAQYPCACVHLTTADFNGDGVADIATSGVFIYLGKGDGTFGAPTLPFPGGDGFIGTADLNGDGVPDILTAQPRSDRFVIGFGAGNGTFGSVSRTGVSGVISGVLADFNNDGLPDLAVLSGSQISVYLNIGNGKLARSSYFSTGFNSKANTIAVADFNGDGMLDIAAPGLDLQIFPGFGDGTFGPGADFGAANFPNVVVAADFFDFGTVSKPDLIGVGQNGAVSTLFNKSH